MSFGDSTSSVLRRLRSRLRAAPGLGVRQSGADDLEVLNVMLGTLLSQTRWDRAAPLRQAEYRVFSQFGDDGIIQRLLRTLDLPAHLQTFVEFGVEDYSESNTRFLLMKDNWRGLIMDGDAANMAAVRESDLYWRHDLTALAAFIDRDNVNDLIRESGFGGEIGLLSIDIDGNDYWVWQALTVVDPAVVVVEYNSVFGPDRALTVPYDPGFRRFDAHYSGLYWGCSVRGFALLAQAKGYVFLGCNSAGNNAYFARRDVASQFPNPSIEQGYVESRFRESRGKDGELTFVAGQDRLPLMKGMPLVDLESGATIRVDELIVQ